MSRWWRAYDEAVDDPKLIALTDRQFRAWFNLCCITSQTGGTLPDVKIVAIKLRVKPDRAQAIMAELGDLGLIDKSEDGVSTMHNWNGRQYKSDVSTTRVKRFRNGKRNVSETPPETENRDRSRDSVADATGADAPVDHRKRLFDEGLPKLARMTGKGPDACRSFVGKCLKAAGDDAITVLGLIEDAERNQAVDPTSWIVARLKNNQPSQGNSNGRRTVHDAADDLLARVRALDEPAPRSLRDGTGEGPVRLLPPR